MEYHELQKEAAEARVGADRMAMGLSCIPDPLRGDMAEVDRLCGEVESWKVDVCSMNASFFEKDAEIERLRAALRAMVDAWASVEGVNRRIWDEARRALEPQP